MDWGQSEGGVHPGDECCPRLTSSNSYIMSHWCQLKVLKTHAGLTQGFHQPQLQVITEMISDEKSLRFSHHKRACRHFLGGIF